MPAALSYPGVYIEEVPSGVRAITGVATSVAAFVGRMRRGPTNIPVVVNSYSDVERRFGRLWDESTMSFALRDFFLNGGSQAVVVRLFHPSFLNETTRLAVLATATTEAQSAANAIESAADTAVTATATAQDVVSAAISAVAVAGAPGPAALSAASAAAQAASDAATLTAATAQKVADAVTAAKPSIVAVAAAMQAPVTRARLSVDTLELEAAFEGASGNGLRARVDHETSDKGSITPPASLFNLYMRGGIGEIEVHRNLSVDQFHPRFVQNVLADQSQLVRLVGSVPLTRPAANVVPAPGADPFDATTSSGVVVFASDGVELDVDDYVNGGSKKGIFALDDADIFNLLCIPPISFKKDVDNTVWEPAARYCEKRRAMLIIDPPSGWTTKEDALKLGSGIDSIASSTNAAIYFPRVQMPNSEHDNQVETFAPCGIVAGVIARTDVQRGIWKAPAGLDATLFGVSALAVSLTDAENGELNPLGINCLRTFPAAGRVIWGARTRKGADRLAHEWKYLPVRRTALFLEESLYRGTQWVVFEPNDEPLWAQIRLNIGAFMQNLFRQGAFQGKSPREAYFVKCDKETTTQTDINSGVVNIHVGFAPLKPAEFVVIKIQQIAGDIPT